MLPEPSPFSRRLSCAAVLVTRILRHTTFLRPPRPPHDVSAFAPHDDFVPFYGVPSSTTSSPSATSPPSPPTTTLAPSTASPSSATLAPATACPLLRLWPLLRRALFYVVVPICDVSAFAPHDDFAPLLQRRPLLRFVPPSTASPPSPPSTACPLLRRRPLLRYRHLCPLLRRHPFYSVALFCDFVPFNSM